MLDHREGLKKGYHQVIGYLMISVIVLVGQGFSWGVGSIQKGEKAYDDVQKLKVRQDTMEVRCAKKNFDDALFKQEVRNEVKGVKEDVVEMKGDLKWMRENWNQKK